MVDVLVRKSRRALQREGLRALVVCGGVAANRGLRAALAAAAAEDGFGLYIPSPRLCTDNAAMIAAAGTELLRRGRRVVAGPERRSRAAAVSDRRRATAPATSARGRRAGAAGAARAAAEEVAGGRTSWTIARVIERIVQAAALAPADVVVEIGAGLGALTRALARGGRRG